MTRRARQAKAFNPDAIDPFEQLPKSHLAPTVPSQELYDEICRRIRSGRTVRSICNDDDMPSHVRFYDWMHADEVFREQYARAKADSATADADDADQIRLHVAQGKMDPQAARVAIDAIKWSAAHKQPKKYGAQVKLEHDVGGSLEELLRESLGEGAGAEGGGGGS